jgi:hypothetical protein
LLPYFLGLVFIWRTENYHAGALADASLISDAVS